ncbi:MAG: hypothetical protein J5944_09035 [Lentisphaeria bacterium]|nr:hypothetical protein [Lentisphaeria bacterium]
MKRILTPFVLLMLVCTAFAGEKHFIGHGWDLLKVTTEDLVRNLPELEKLPLDGISISLSKKRADGRTVFMRNVLSDARWVKEEYAGEIENIKKISSGRLKYNLLMTNFAPTRRLAWTDDAAWERAEHNAGAFAAIAKAGGLKGFMLDPEDYPKTKQFMHLPGDPAYPEAVKLARRRGAQIMKAMGAEHPDMVLLSFSFLGGRYAADEPWKEAERSGNLWPAFINGLLDELPSGAVMVDASEDGYTCTGLRNEFYELAWKIVRKGGKLIAPENRAKFYQQYQIGFGLYLDMYTDMSVKIHTKSKWYHPPTDGSRLITLFNNFSEAVACADQYCWVYGEYNSWIKWDCAERLSKTPWPVDPETWEEKLPGLTDTMNFIIDEDRAVREMYEKKAENGGLVNLIGNPECVPVKKVRVGEAQSDWDTRTLPPGWAFWRNDPKEGSFALDTTTGMGDSFSARAVGADNACLVHKPAMKVKPGQVYACEAFKKGGEKSYVLVRWMHDNRWIIQPRNVLLPFSEEKNAEGWQRAFGFVKVPPEANELVLLVYTCLKPDEAAWYDNPGVYLIYPPAAETP